MKILKLVSLIALLAVTTSGAQTVTSDLPLPVAVRDDMGLPPVPHFVVSQLGPTPVLMVHNLRCMGTPALGCFIGHIHTIFLKDSMPLNVAWQTLEHEKVHMILWDAGHTLPEDKEDAIADAIGANRVAEMLARNH
jgi:hypothetical protein